MFYLADSNIFLRLADRNSPQNQVTLRAIGKLRFYNNAIRYTPQVRAEFWNVGTRPATARGGFGFSVEQTERRAQIIQKHFRILPDNLPTFLEWRKLVSDFSVTGVQVHDAKIAASVIVHEVDYLLTFNEKDFSRFPMIRVVNPASI